jgi:hypothetical protein
MDELKLIYVNHVGSNWRDLNLYEFLFSDTDEDVEGDDWNVCPASVGDVTPPPTHHVRKVGYLETELDLIVVADSDTFSVYDAVDGVTPLAYEDVDGYDVYPDFRLVFKYGDKISEVNENLFAKEIILQFKDINHEED